MWRNLVYVLYSVYLFKSTFNSILENYKIARLHQTIAKRTLHDNFNLKFHPLHLGDLICDLRCVFLLYCDHMIYWNVRLFLNQSFFKATVKYLYNDPEIFQQWYYITRNYLTLHLSHELDSLWALGIDGRGVVIAIIDGGIETYHRDLLNNYERNMSFNFVTHNSLIYPSNHGRPTRSAGLISAAGNNHQCGVGAAPQSTFCNLQVFDDSNLLLNEDRISRALEFQTTNIHIYLLNWRINHLAQMRFHPSYSTSSILKYGYKFGRSALGSLYIIGSGNYRQQGSNCGFDGYMQRPEVFVFGAISSLGTIPSNIEGCSAVLAASLSTDEFFTSEQLFTTTSSNQCQKSTGGSSAASAISCGILALLISNNTSLTVRQILILIVLTSIQYDHDAIRNFKGLYYSYYSGFGLLNAHALIQCSWNEDIRSIRREQICHSVIFVGRHVINRLNSSNFYMYSSGCLNFDYCVSEIEQVLVVFSLTASRRKTVSIYLTSPSGTRFILMQSRPFDVGRTGFSKWTTKLMGYFGERAIGVWKFEIVANTSSCVLTMAEFIFHGTCNYPLQNVAYHSKVERRLEQIKFSLNSHLFRSTESSVDYNFYPYEGRDTSSFSAIDLDSITSLNSLDHNTFLN